VEIPYEGHVLRDVMVPMRDGIELAVDVYLPDGDDPAPALLALSPYGKNTQRTLLVQPMPSALGDACIEAGWTPDICARGYVHVIACTRGSGQSQGTYRSMYSEQESLDGYDLVEWIAAQDWCEGSVGMLGISYFGTTQLVVASSRPPHLKAIAPLEATTDQYLACYHGGVLDGFYSELFTGRHSTLGWSGFQPADMRSKSELDWDPEELEQRVAELKANPDVNQYNLLYSVLDCPSKNPILFDILVNEWDDDGTYWWNPELSNIDIPVFCGVAWFPDCGPKFVRGPFMIWDGVKGPTKMAIHRAGWLERPFHQFHDELLDFFDCHLKGIDNGAMDGPPIRLFVNGEERYRDEREWPLARTQWTDYHLHPHGRLAPEAPRYGAVEPDGYTQPPLFVTDEIRSLRYSTGPLPSALEVTGPITLHLHAALDAEDSWFKARIFDVDPAGNAIELTHGHLRCSHRELDAGRSKPWQPVHKHTRDAVGPVVPGEVNEYAIELYPMSNLFAKGHELVLAISSGDLPGHQFSYHVMPGRTVSYRVHRDSVHPSRLLLPVIPR
jgi:uncharacterized protein